MLYEIFSGVFGGLVFISLLLWAIPYSMFLYNRLYKKELPRFYAWLSTDFGSFL